MSKALEMVKKMLAILPVVYSVVAEVQAAKDKDSAGGTKVTPVEIGEIVMHGVQRLGQAIIALFEEKKQLA